MSDNCLDENNFNEIVSFLSENYEKGELATLNESEAQLLDETAENLALIFSSKNIEFNKNGFIDIVKKCSSFINDTSSGGMKRSSTLPTLPSMRSNLGNQQLAVRAPEDQPLVVRDRQNNNSRFNRYDFLAILGLFVAIFVAYLSYLELNRSLIEFTEQDISELSDGLREQVQTAISSTPREELSFMSYLYNIFTTFTCNIAQQTTASLQFAITRILTSAIPDFSSQIAHICGSRESGLFGVAESIFKSVLNPQGNQECVMRLTQTLVEQFVSERQNRLNIMLVSMQASNTTIQSYIRFAIGLGYSSCSYLVYRLKNGLRKPTLRLRNDSDLLAIEEGGSRNRKHRKSKKNKKSKKSRKSKRNSKKYRKRTKGGVKTKEQIQREMMKGATPMTPVELRRLEEADRIAEERERNDNEIRRINADLERQRINTITSFPSTPMSPEDARRQQQQDLLDNERVNSKEAKSRRLTVADLGGSKRRHRKDRKSKKHKKIRGGNRFGGNNIGANCSDPNFSIYNTNLLKLFPYKGGNLQSDDIYKNLEGPQF